MSPRPLPLLLPLLLACATANPILFTRSTQPVARRHADDTCFSAEQRRSMQEEMQVLREQLRMLQQAQGAPPGGRAALGRKRLRGENSTNLAGASASLAAKGASAAGKAMQAEPPASVAG